MNTLFRVSLQSPMHKFDDVTTENKHINPECINVKTHEKFFQHTQKKISQAPLTPKRENNNHWDFGTGKR